MTLTALQHLTLQQRLAIATNGPQGFRAWLKKQPALAHVGTTQLPSFCPLASWLKSIFGDWFDVVVNGASITLYEHNTLVAMVDTPNWASDFVCLVDSDQPAHGVTALDALGLLAQVAPVVRYGG